MYSLQYGSAPLDTIAPVNHTPIDSRWDDLKALLS
jgi:hypothetical protein